MMNPQFAGMGMGMNFGMQNPNMNFNMNMPNNFMNMNMNMMEMGQDEEWLKGFKMGVEEVNNTGDQDSDANSPGPKINVIFKTTQGTTHTMVYNYGTTIDKSLANTMVLLSPVIISTISFKDFSCSIKELILGAFFTASSNLVISSFVASGINSIL